MCNVVLINKRFNPTIITKLTINIKTTNKL
jgi:hypothetical protein